MAIVKMQKFNLYSFDSKRDFLLKALQKFKYVHFNNLIQEKEEEEELEKVEIPEVLLELEEDISKAQWAIDLLRKFEVKKSAIQNMKDGNESLTLLELTNRAEKFDFNKHYNELYDLSEERASFEQKIQNINIHIDELRPWEDIPYDIESLNSLENFEIRLGSIATKYLEGFNKDIEGLELTTSEIVSATTRITYLIVISEKKDIEGLENAIRRNGFSEIHLRTKKIVKEEISILSNEKKELKSKIKKIDDEIYKNANLVNDFRLYYEYLKNKKLRFAASENFLKTEKVDLIEGYIPSDKKEDFIKVLDDLLGKNDYYIEVKEAEKDDPKVPIMLKNNKFAGAFESLTEMYSMPRYNEIDPTPLFAPFYFIFAGIMVGDFGYGLLLFIATTIALKKFNLESSKRKFIRFFNYLSISTMIWGLIFGSFFGDVIPMKALIDPSSDYVEMILMSLILGGIHIFFALGIKAYMDIRDKKPLDALYDVGFWYMALVGAIVLIVSTQMPINTIIVKISKYAMILGMIGIVLTGGREEKSIGGRIGWGIYSLYGITSYFGDFVSYLRLMALALAGSFIAIAVNIIVRMLLSGGIVGIIVGVLIFLMFQLFNMFLSFLSAYVHSARLTYVEMFNKFYEGGGVPFKDMIEKSKYFNIKEE